MHLAMFSFDVVELELADMGFAAAGFDIQSHAAGGYRFEGVDLLVADGTGFGDLLPRVSVEDFYGVLPDLLAFVEPFHVLR